MSKKALMVGHKLAWVVVLSIVLVSGTAAQADTITHGSTTINMDFVNVGQCRATRRTPCDTWQPATARWATTTASARTT